MSAPEAKPVSAAPRPRVRVVGFGNPDAGDDAAGLMAVREVRARLHGTAGVDVVEAGPASKLLDLMDDVEAVVAVDAVRFPDGPHRPGKVVRAEAGPAGLPAELGAALSSHGLGLADSIAIAGALGTVPDVVFLGIEAEDVAMGKPPSQRVAAAIPELVGMIEREVRRLLDDEREKR
jgi:hydrogenase maturation protease